MVEMIITEVVMTLLDLLAELAIVLIGAGGAWLTMQIGKSEKLGSIQKAQQEVITMAQITVGELNQTVVAGLREKHADGKLDESEIIDLGEELFALTVKKLAEPTIKLLEAAGVDITALIRGAAEDWINSLKKEA